MSVGTGVLVGKGVLVGTGVYVFVGIEIFVGRGVAVGAMVGVSVGTSVGVIVARVGLGDPVGVGVNVRPVATTPACATCRLAELETTAACWMVAQFSHDLVGM